MRTFILSMAAALLAAGSASAVERCGGPRDCGACGKSDCRVVCEMKTVKKHCWVVECEQLCPTLPKCPKWCWGCFSFCGGKCSKKACGSGCGEDACGAGCGDACGKGCPSKRMVPPKCGKKRTVKKLVKKEYECEVPVYKCTACGACGSCGDGCGEEAAPPAMPAEAPVPAVSRAPMPRSVGSSYPTPVPPM